MFNLIINSFFFNILYTTSVLLVWKTLNKEQPQINNICFNGKTCVVFLTQILCPRMFPWIKIALPVTVVLEFKETDKDSGLLKIDTHSEHWTIEGKKYSFFYFYFFTPNLLLIINF